MDFVNLAEHEASARKFALRYLIGETQDEVTSSSSYNNIRAASAVTESDDDYDVMLQPGKSPILSKEAEAELYLLATNFLLYVAMVIIITFIAKTYFPESLKRGPTTDSRTFSYRMAGASLDDRYYSSDCSENSDEDENGEGHGDENALYSDASTGNKDEGSDKKKEGEVRFGDNPEDQQDEETQDLLSSPEPQQQEQQQQRRKNFLEFEQEQMPRTEVLKRLMICSLMLNITFVAWGVLQERMLTRRYPRYVGDYFTYSYALVFTNRFWTLIMSGLLLYYLKPRASRSTVIYEYSFPSISNMLSSWCQYEALRYVSFPALTLFKSFKLAPVMAMGKILGNKTYPQYDYFVALFIGIGITMFMSSTDELNFTFAFDATGKNNMGGTWCGVMLLLFFLFFDSFTSQFQSRMFQRHRDLSMVELMFATSAFSTVLSFVTLVHTKEMYPALEFIKNHSEIHLHFFLFSICSTIGQLFIFYTIKNFGAVVFTLIMTTRILLSIALSCVLYGHHVSAIGFIGLMIVLGSVLYRIRRKAQGKQLVKWQGMEDDSKDKELVEEWHEHVDM